MSETAHGLGVPKWSERAILRKEFSRFGWGAAGSEGYDGNVLDDEKIMRWFGFVLAYMFAFSLDQLCRVLVVLPRDSMTVNICKSSFTLCLP